MESPERDELPLFAEWAVLGKQGAFWGWSWLASPFEHNTGIVVRTLFELAQIGKAPRRLGGGLVEVPAAEDSEIEGHCTRRPKLDKVGALCAQ